MVFNLRCWPKKFRPEKNQKRERERRTEDSSFTVTITQSTIPLSRQKGTGKQTYLKRLCHTNQRKRTTGQANLEQHRHPSFEENVQAQQCMASSSNIIIIIIKTRNIDEDTACRMKLLRLFPVTLVVVGIITCHMTVDHHHHHHHHHHHQYCVYHTATALSSTPRPSRRPSSSSPSSSSSSLNRKRKSRNEDWYERRKQSTTAKHHQQQKQQPTRRRSGPKPPKWEKEGDQLYMKISNNKSRSLSNNVEEDALITEPKTIPEAREFLRPYLLDDTSLKTTETTRSSSPLSDISNDDESNRGTSHGTDSDDDDDDDDKPFVWGGLPVGPVWKSRLVSAGFNKPTPIQKETYQALSRGNDNAVIAAPTGSGKSLAYLLPFLTKGTKSIGEIWVVCPTMELAYQLQNVVDRLCSTKNGRGGRRGGGGDDGDASNLPAHHQSYFHVVGGKSMQTIGDDKELVSSTPYPLLQRLQDQCSTDGPFFLASTPKIFRQLQREIDGALGRQRGYNTSRSRFNKSYHSQVKEGRNELDVDENDDVRKLALIIDKNLATIVFDEADRLFQTEKSVAFMDSRKDFSLDSKKQKPPAKIPPPLSVTLLETCLYRANSNSKGYSGRNNYKGNRNRPTPPQNVQVVAVSATVGRSLRRQLMRTLQAPSIDAAARLVTLVDRSKKNMDARRSSLLPSSLKHSYRLFETSLSDASKRNDETEIQRILLNEIVDTIKSIQPSPVLIFPGRKLGVEAVQSHLRRVGFKDIRGLKTLEHSLGDDQNESNVEYSISEEWATTPVYVIKERLGRGLDLPAVQYVLLVGVPSSPSAYIHLAGRTARNNSSGKVITLCQPSEALRLGRIADSLGLTRSRN